MTDDALSEDDINEQFRQMTDRFIDLANQQAETIQPENVGMALLYAASRYNAFVVAMHADDLEKYRQDHATALEFFTAEYQRMLEENLEDYLQAFDQDMKYAHLLKKH